MIKNDIYSIGINQIDIVSKVESEISSLDLREDNRKYISFIVNF